MFINYLINGLTLGAVYALAAVGYSTVFGTLRLINFAHSTVYAFGSIMSWVALEVLHWPVLPAILFAAAAAAILNMMIDKLTLVPIRNKQGVGVSAMVATIGASFMLQSIMEIVFGSEYKRFPSFFDFGKIQLGAFSIGSAQLIITLVALLIMVVLIVIIQKTPAGLEMRAVEQNSKAAKICGIKVNKVITLAFLLAGASAAIAGALIGGYYQMLSPSMGSMTGLKAFAAAGLGGIGSVPGAILGGLIIGCCEILGTAWLGGQVTDCIAFIILFLVLMIKPTGFFGKATITKV